MTNYEPDEVPYFIKVRGCINCEAHETYKERHGKDYGFDHEINVKCLLMDCQSQGHMLHYPFFDPEEVVRLAVEKNTEEWRKRAKEYCQKIKDKFGHHYETRGVCLDEIMNKL